VSPATSHTVRVGVVSWNTADLLDRCLGALPAALAGTEAEVVVVDNASSDASAEVAAAHPGVRVVRNPANVGYARAMNQALAGGGVEALIALNPDTEPPPGSLATLVSRLLADRGVALVAPTLLGADGRPQWTARRFPSLGVGAATCLLPGRWQGGRLGRRLNLELADQPTRPADVDWAIGAVHVIRADAVAGRVPYDERWFMYVEDLELCWWLARRGWRRRFEADVAIPHVGNAAGGQAWGEDYMGRCFDAMYDWYERDRSPIGVRAWAALNAVRVVSRTGVGVLARRPDDHLAALRRELPHHTRVVLRGAPPPAGRPAP
jgi:N-acetylglucosaminyl-diphospho-decaprenol L-rhamnosyltransferase